MDDSNRSVFISYRRSTSAFIARAVFQDLRAHGYDVFMDVQSIDSGTFDTVILDQIAASAHFVVILTPGSVDRCVNEDGTENLGDWLRREIETAMDLQRNIVPLLVNNFDFQNAERFLVGKLSQLSRFNAVTVPHDYFEEAMARLRSRFLKQPVYGTITPIQRAQQAVVQQKIASAATQPAPTTHELNAEQAADSGYARYLDEDYEGAIADYTEALRLNPHYPRAYNNRGRAYRKLGQLDEALVDYAEAIRLDPGYAEAYYNRGIAHYYLGNYEQAVADYTEALRLNPQDADSYFNRSLVKKALGDTEGARRDYVEYMLVKYPTAVRHIQRGDIHLAQGDLDEAIADYTRAIEMRPDDDLAYRKRGWARYQQLDYVGALRDYNAAIERMRVDDAESYFRRAFVRTDMGDIEEAIADYTAVIRLEPDSPSACINRGELYIEIGQYEEAVADFEQAVSLNPDDPMSRGGLAVACYMLGKRDEARALWRQLIEFDENYRDIDWVKRQLNWVEALAAVAREIVISL